MMNYLPGNLIIDWAPHGDDKPLAVYEYEANRLTYNESVPLLMEWRNDGDSQALAMVAAAHIANALVELGGEIECAYGDTFWGVFRELMERIVGADEDKSLTPEWRAWIDREVSRLEQADVAVDG
jgi:hypothetical protein